MERGRSGGGGNSQMDTRLHKRDSQVRIREKKDFLLCFFLSFCPSFFLSFCLSVFLSVFLSATEFSVADYDSTLCGVVVVVVVVGVGVSVQIKNGIF